MATPKPKPKPEKWQPTASDIITIVALVGAVVMWYVQPDWQIGAPITVVTIAVVIAAAARHQSHPLVRRLASDLDQLPQGLSACDLQLASHARSAGSTSRFCEASPPSSGLAFAHPDDPLAFVVDQPRLHAGATSDTPLSLSMRDVPTMKEDLHHLVEDLPWNWNRQAAKLAA